MPFKSGGVTARRFRVPARGEFGSDDVAKLAEFGFWKKLQPDGKSDATFGWGAGDDVLDAEFLDEKQLRGDFVLCSFRVSQTRFPPEEVKARVRVEVDALLKEGAKPGPKVKKEARENALAWFAEAAKDGRYTKHSAIPVAWDRAGEVWFGHTSHAHDAAFAWLFEKTFGVSPTAITAGALIPDGCDLPDVERPAWLDDGQAADGWGNRWAMWLLKECMTGRDEFPHSRAMGVPEMATAMVARRLVMDCPRAERGKDSFAFECPATMPEVAQAVKQGKLPTAVGLELVAGGHFKAVLDPAAWAVTGLALPPPTDGLKGAALEVQRLEACRSFFAVLDGLYRTHLGAVGP